MSPHINDIKESKSFDLIDSKKIGLSSDVPSGSRDPFVAGGIDSISRNTSDLLVRRSSGMRYRVAST